MLEYIYNNHDDYKNEVLIGIDEAGLGPLLGNGFICCVIWHPDPTTGKLKGHDNPLIHKVRDSKKISKVPKKREELRKFIEDNCNCFKIIQITPEEIDEKNILHARLDGYTRVLDEMYIEYKFDRILVDGNQFNTYSLSNNYIIPHTCIEKGDDIYLQIAAASILAKIYHDIYMIKLVDDYPELEKYNLRKNVGYGTAAHIAAIKEHGFTQFHRKSFNPVKTMIENKTAKLNYVFKSNNIVETNDNDNDNDNNNDNNNNNNNDNNNDIVKK